MDTNLMMSLIVGAFVGAASAYLGSIMVLKRMALVGDALSHVALPGIGIALTYNLNPFLGAFTALALGILLIWQIEKKTGIPTEALVGLIFASSLAIGILVTPEPELLEALFGDIAEVGVGDAVLGIILSLIVFISMSFIKNNLVLGIISPDFAKAQGIKINWLNLFFLGLVAIVVALGVKVVGTLLMGSLVVIPAVASKNIARNFNAYGLISLLLGLVGAVSGVFLAALWNLPPGPIVVLVSAAIFLVTLPFANRS
jgi:ABC-type Mn2+/Zn2+ transport system permease subunit